MNPSFDTWTSMFLIVAGFGIFLFLLLLGNAENRKNNAPIALVVLAFSTILFQYVLFWTGYVKYYPYSGMVPPICYYLLGPLLYFYFYRLFFNQSPGYKVVHFIPAMVLTGLLLFQWLAPNNPASQQVYQFLRPLYFLLHAWMIAAHMFVYALLLWRLNKAAAVDTPNQFSQLRQKWTNLLTQLFTLFIIAYVSYYILVQFPFFNAAWDYSISMVMSLCIYSIGYMAFRSPAIFNGELYTHLFIPVVVGSADRDNRSLDGFYQKLLKYLEEEKPYLDSELRLVNLADQMGFSIHLLSQTINEKSGKNFNQLINEYRLREAEDLLLNAPDLSIKSIYYQSGFHNKATFYTAFKKKFNCTPSQFRNQELRLRGT